jgi:triosephosphate isomerase
MRTLFVAGNWKMNLDLASAKSLAEAVKESAAANASVKVGVGPTFVHLPAAIDILKGTDVAVAAQNMYFEPNGAFTGETSGEMLVDIGASHVILGHSERRHVMGESDELICRKIHRALAVGLKVIFCIGEQLEEREKNLTEAVLERQVAEGLKGVEAGKMSEITLAYEPVWAIGTGKTATPDIAQQAHAFVRGLLEKAYNKDVAEATIVQYGGSVKPANARELMSCPDIDGALVGGASLKADSFGEIISEAAAVRK